MNYLWILVLLFYLILSLATFLYLIKEKYNKNDQKYDISIKENTDINILIFLFCVSFISIVFGIASFVIYLKYNFYDDKDDKDDKNSNLRDYYYNTFIGLIITSLILLTLTIIPTLYINYKFNKFPQLTANI
jgi:heme/copper-type cytochrome/quinol oxidase subunit 2